MPRRDADDLPVEVEAIRGFAEQPDEAPRDVAESDQDQRQLGLVHATAGATGATGARYGDANRSLQPIETGAVVLGRLAEAETQVAVHAEVIAGHNQHALLLAQARHQRRRVDRVVVAHVDDGARFGPDPVEAARVVQPRPRSAAGCGAGCRACARTIAPGAPASARRARGDRSARRARSSRSRGTTTATRSATADRQSSRCAGRAGRRLSTIRS